MRRIRPRHPECKFCRKPTAHSALAAVWPGVEGGYLSYAVRAPARRSIAISRSCARISARMRVISLRIQSSFYSALTSSGTSPNFRITFASPK
jgi:hypothetical protein